MDSVVDGAGNGRTVLVVDDDPDVREILDVNLTAAGYEVEQAEDGIEALDIMAGTPPDLVILDISMPRMDGWEVLQRVRADRGLRDIPVLVLTAHSDEGSVIHGLSLGAVEYATKPFVPEHVVSSVEMLLSLMDHRLRQERRQAQINRREMRRHALPVAASSDEARKVA